VLSSPESAILLSDVYDDINGLKGNSEADKLFGSVLYREEEDLVVCTRLDSLIKIYSSYNIKEFFGLSLNEFMDLPGWKINSLTENAIEIMEEKEKELAELQEEVENDASNIENSMERTMYDIGELRG